MRPLCWRRRRPLAPRTTAFSAVAAATAPAGNGALAGQQWHLRYLDGWEASFEGDYAKAEPLLRDVAAHAADTDLQSLANGTLLNILAIGHHYEEAFELADRLAASIPRIRDRKVAYAVLSQLSQLMASARQVDPAASYARQMQQFAEPGKSLCKPYVYLFGALECQRRSAADRPDLSPGDRCLQRRQ